MRKQQLTPQQSIKMFLVSLFFMALLAILTSCSESGKREPDHTRIGEMFRAQTSEGLSIAAYTDKPALHRVGDTVIVISGPGSDHWTLHESPTYTRDTLTSMIEYKRVVIKR